MAERLEKSGFRTVVKLRPSKCRSLLEQSTETKYVVNDGSIVRLKTVVTDIFKLDEFDANGNPSYIVRSSQVLSVSPPERARKQEERAGHWH